MSNGELTLYDKDILVSELDVLHQEYLEWGRVMQLLNRRDEELWDLNPQPRFHRAPAPTIMEKTLRISIIGRFAVLIARYGRELALETYKERRGVENSAYIFLRDVGVILSSRNPHAYLDPVTPKRSGRFDAVIEDKE